MNVLFSAGNMNILATLLLSLMIILSMLESITTRDSRSIAIGSAPLKNNYKLGLCIGYMTFPYNCGCTPSVMLDLVGDKKSMETIDKVLTEFV